MISRCGQQIGAVGVSESVSLAAPTMHPAAAADRWSPGVTTLATEQGAKTSHGVVEHLSARDGAAADLGCDRRGALGVDVGDQDLGAVAARSCASAAPTWPAPWISTRAPSMPSRSSTCSTAARTAAATPSAGPRRGVLVVSRRRLHRTSRHRLQVLDASCPCRHRADKRRRCAARTRRSARISATPVGTPASGAMITDFAPPIGQPGEGVLQRHRRSQALSLVIAAARSGSARSARRRARGRASCRRSRSRRAIPRSSSRHSTSCSLCQKSHAARPAMATCLLRRNRRSATSKVCRWPDEHNSVRSASDSKAQDFERQPRSAKRVFLRTAQGNSGISCASHATT